MLTYVALGVANGGAATQPAAFQNTWNLFAGPANVKSWDNRPLQYYPSGVNFSGCALDASGLVTGSGSGQCGAFQLLLYSALQVNGISSNLIGVFTRDNSGFMVNQWKFGSTPGVTHYQGFSYTLRLSQEFWTSGNRFVGMVVANGSGTYGDMLSVLGNPGQSSATPSEKYFGSHYILSVSPLIAGPAGPYFDPSYGTTYTSPTSFEQSVAGYGYPKATYLSGSTPVYSDYGARTPGVPVNICFAVASGLNYAGCTIF